MTELTINADSLIESTLTPDQYILLLLIHKKEYKLADKLILKLFGWTDTYVGEIYDMLEEDGWLKINGDKKSKDCVVRQKFLELLNTGTDMNIESWIDEYRNLFKGKKPGCFGDKGLCIKHMTWLLTSYPEYTKEHVMKAANYYISTCAKDNYKYLVRSHYFLSKEDSTGTANHQILTYLDEVNSDDFVESKDFTTSI